MSLPPSHLRDVAHRRQDYARDSLDESEAAVDPFIQFERWFNQAVEARVPEPEAMTLATVDASGAPSARTVLLKGFSPSGLVFFTNYESAKGRDLEREPRVALLFFWQPLERQVRIQGEARKVPTGESEVYFHSRPRESQIGAAASPQSRVISSRQELEARIVELRERYEGSDIPLPDYWGGYRVVPHSFEFWQGRKSRLHDRLSYSLEGNAWRRVRLAP